jgi:allantoin racemase
MRILVVNCNTNSDVTAVIAENARTVARPGTEIVGVQPSWGPESAEGFYESFVTAAAVLDTLARYPDEFDAVVMAGFGEHGREGVRQLLDVPVVDITEAAAQLACLVSYRFGIVTTMTSAIGGIEESLSSMGLIERCSGIGAAELPVSSIHYSPDVVSRLAEVGRRLQNDGADAIVLGCAGFAGLDERLQDVLGLPVIDGVTAAVAWAESMVHLGKMTSKSGYFASPRSDKKWVDWPRSEGNVVRA